MVSYIDFESSAQMPLRFNFLRIPSSVLISNRTHLKLSTVLISLAIFRGIHKELDPLECENLLCLYWLDILCLDSLDMSPCRGGIQN